MEVDNKGRGEIKAHSNFTHHCDSTQHGLYTQTKGPGNTGSQFSHSILFQHEHNKKQTRNASGVDLRFSLERLNCGSSDVLVLDRRMTNHCATLSATFHVTVRVAAKTMG